MQKTLLDFWFGPLTGPEAFNRDRYDLWFQNGRAYDQIIRERFGKGWRQAVAGELDGWAETAQGRLALILLLDQVPRHPHSPRYSGSVRAGSSSTSTDPGGHGARP